MGDWRLLAIAGVAVHIGFCCTVLPGVIAWVGAAVRRRPRPGVLGPLFWHDLVKLARRGQQLRLRPAFTLILLVGLFVTYLEQFREVNPLLLFTGTDVAFPIDRMSAFGERFLTIYLYCQLAAVVLVTPVLAGGAVTEERDRGTLDYLRSSLLSNRELVAAYLTSRLVYIFGLMLTGLPVLGVTMMFGGVDGDILVAGTTIAGMTALSLGTFALYLGLTRPSQREVLFWCYGSILVLSLLGVMCCCFPPLWVLSPFNATYMLQHNNSGRWLELDLVATTGSFVGVHGTLSAVFIWWATLYVRVPPEEWRARVGRPLPGHTADEGAEPPGRPNVVYRDTSPRSRARPPVRAFVVPRLGASDPLLWKERYFSGRLGGSERGLAVGCGALFVGLLLLPIGLTLFVAVAQHLERGTDVATTLNPLLRWCAVGVATLLVPFAGFWAVSCVTRERERQTLDALFTLPVTRLELLAAKWWAAAGLLRYWLYGLAGMAVLAVLSGSVHPFGLFAAGVMVVGFCAFTTTLAVWLSVRCRTTTRAMSWFAGLLLAVSILPMPVAILARSAVDLLGSIGGRDRWLIETVIESASVPYATFHALFQWDSTRPFDDELGRAAGAGFAGLVYAVAALLLWRGAVRRFEAEGR